MTTKIDELLGKVKAHVALGAGISGITRREALIALDEIAAVPAPSVLGEGTDAPTHWGPRFDAEFRCLRHKENHCPSCLAYALGDANAEIARLRAAPGAGDAPAARSPRTDEDERRRNWWLAGFYSAREQAALYYDGIARHASKKADREHGKRTAEILRNLLPPKEYATALFSSSPSAPPSGDDARGGKEPA